MKRSVLILSVLALGTPATCPAEVMAQKVSLVADNVGCASIVIFGLAYLLVMAEEFTHLRKSKPVVIAAGLIWGMCVCLCPARYAGCSRTSGSPQRTRVCGTHALSPRSHDLHKCAGGTFGI